MDVTQTPERLEEKVIAIDRVSRVQKGGRRFRFRTTVVVGDGAGKVGVGVGKGSDVMSSIAKGTSRAKRAMVTVNLHGTTIPHEVEIAFSGARVLLKPAAEGTGVIAGGAVRNVVEAAGIRDLLTKSLGSSNKVNTAYATFAALTSLQKLGPMLDGGNRKTEDGKKPETSPSSVVSPPISDEKPKAVKKTAAKPKTEKKPVAKKAAVKKAAIKKASK